MKRFLVLMALVQVCSFAATERVLVDLEGVTHYSEEVETPQLVKEQAEKASAWRLSPQRNRTENTPSVGDEIESTGILLDKIVNLGKKVWAVIELGRPVVNVTSQYANALPAGVRASDLENFSPLQFRSIRRTGVNMYGVTVYDVTYTLAHRFGGQYEGRGAYLENVTVLPQETYVAWGFNVNLKVKEVSTVNLGNRENPIASIAMQTEFSVKTVLQDYRTQNLHEFRGDSAEVRSTELK